MSGEDNEMIQKEPNEMHEEESGSDYVGLQGWTKEEKFKLLDGIKTFGSCNTETIQMVVKTKTHEEVVSAIDHFKKKASEKTPARKGKKTVAAQMPLACWAKLLNENLDFSDLQNETAMALRLISQYEKIPNAMYTGNINFKDVYCYLADALEGKPLPKRGPEINIIEKCLYETALFSKHFMSPSMASRACDEMLFSDQEVKYFSRPTASFELTCLRQLIGQKAYNPFNIPEDKLVTPND